MELCGPQVHSQALGCQSILCVHEVHEHPPPKVPCTSCLGYVKFGPAWLRTTTAEAFKLCAVAGQRQAI